MNPVRAKDGVLPPLQAPSERLGVLAWAGLTLLAVLAIVAVALFGPPVAAGFIYEQF